MEIALWQYQRKRQRQRRERRNSRAEQFPLGLGNSSLAAVCGTTIKTQCSGDTRPGRNVATAIAEERHEGRNTDVYFRDLCCVGGWRVCGRYGKRFDSRPQLSIRWECK